MVLRQADRPAQQLTFFADARSPKVLHLAHRGNAMIVFWNPDRRWQLRVAASVTIVQEGPHVEAAWARLRATPAAVDYMAPSAPGTPLSVVQSEICVPHLCILRTDVQEIDWLALQSGGAHRRVRFRGIEAQPLVP